MLTPMISMPFWMISRAWLSSRRTHAGTHAHESSPLHAPTCGDKPHDAGSPHGPRKRHMEQHASVAQAEATRDIRAHTKALSVSGAIAHIAKEEVAHVDETSAIKRTGICEASADAAKRVRDWDEERGPRRATQIHNKRKTCPAAQRSTRVERGRQHRRTLAPPAKAVEPRTNLAAATPSLCLLCDAFLLTVILCNV
ncbi:hypothetical protein BC826DRAFT_593210 [Russula brevipes]|nr:hypothetical protein BC826DRAFT_593210 [Russula brevipes]